MKSVLILLFPIFCLADTPPPGSVLIRGGTDNTKIGNISDALKVNISGGSISIPTGASTSANQATEISYLTSIDSKLTSPILVTATNSANGPTGSMVPTEATQVGGKDGSGNLRAINVDSSGNVGVFGTILAAQSGTWTTGRTWSLLNTTDSVDVGNFPSTFGVTQSTSPWVISGSVTANAGTDLNTSALALESGHLASIDTKLTSPLAVTGTFFQATQPVSAASLPLPTGAATSANQTNGSEKTQIVDGSGNVVGPVQTVSSTNYQPVFLAASGASASAVPSRTIQVGGSDGTNLRTFSTDTSGNLNVNSVSQTGLTSVNLVRNDYSTTNVTTAAYVQLIASTSNTTNQLYIFDSSGQTLFLATGAAGSEVNKAYIVPGGNGQLNLNIPSGTRVSVKAVSATASVGELNITFLK